MENTQKHMYRKQDPALQTQMSDEMLRLKLFWECTPMHPTDIRACAVCGKPGGDYCPLCDLHVHNPCADKIVESSQALDFVDGEIRYDCSCVPECSWL